MPSSFMGRAIRRGTCLSMILMTACISETPTEVYEDENGPDLYTDAYSSSASNCPPEAPAPCEQATGTEMQFLESAVLNHLSRSTTHCRTISDKLLLAISEGRVEKFPKTEYTYWGALVRVRAGYNFSSRRYAFSSAYFDGEAGYGTNQLGKSSIHEGIHELGWGTHPTGAAYSFAEEENCLLN